jgi:hypothetical protein
MPPLRTLVLEIDTFCTGCHYNLHGQVVTIDERLGFPICRCPECGKFHPAGTGITASTLWVRRLATILLFTWATMVLAGFVAIAVAFCPLQVASSEAFTYGQSLPTAQNKWHYIFLMHPWQAQGTPETNGLATMLSISAGSLFSGFIAGTLCVTLLWHWPRWRYLWMLLLPAIPVTILVMVYRQIPEYVIIRLDCIEHLLSQAGIQSLGILLGVLLGRKVSRFLIRAIIPPKPRQALAFLWSVDGKKL